MKIYYTFSFILFLFLFSSCKKDKEEVVQTLSKLDLSDAKVLFLVGNAYANTSELMKIKTDGTIEKVKMIDQNGDELKEYLHPQIISNANPNFILLALSDRLSNKVGYLIKKSDGTITKVLNDFGYPDPNPNNLRNNSVSTVDGSYNIYYKSILNSVTSVVKINTVNPNLVSVQRLTPSNDNVVQFDIDAWDNILYYTLESGITRRIKKGTGGLLSAPTDLKHYAFWTGKDGNFYYLTFSSSYKIKKATYDDVNDVFSFSDYYSGTQTWAVDISSTYRLEYGGKLVLITASEILEIENSTNVPAHITSVPVSNIKVVGKSVINGNLYVVGDAAGGQTIFKIDLNNNYSYTTLFTAGKYDIYDMEVFEDGTIYFSALRMSDTKYVFVKIAADGTETVLDSTLDKKGIFMEKATEYIY